MANKPALLVFRAGYLWPTGRCFEDAYIKVPIMLPRVETYGENAPPTTAGFSTLYFIFIGEAGPYAVYAEI